MCVPVLIMAAGFRVLCLCWSSSQLEPFPVVTIDLQSSIYNLTLLLGGIFFPCWIRSGINSLDHLHCLQTLLHVWGTEEVIIRGARLGGWDCSVCLEKNRVCLCVYILLFTFTVWLDTENLVVCHCFVISSPLAYFNISKAIVCWKEK